MVAIAFQYELGATRYGMYHALCGTGKLADPIISETSLHCDGVSGSCWQWFAFGLFAERQERDTNHKSQGSESDGRAHSLKMTNTGSDQKSEARRREAPDIGDKGEGAGTTFCRVLF